jgi:RNA polymerase sigma-70 factor (ECF subfamily)
VTAIAFPLPAAAFGEEASLPSGSEAPAAPAETLERAQAGDHRAFKQLYDAHLGRIYALTLRMAGNVAEAEELTQAVFIRAWERLPSFRGDSAFSTWLYRLAVNEVLGAWRSDRRRERRVRVSDDLEAEAAPLEPPPGEPIDLEGAIARLPAGARAVFVLHDIEGYRHEEIAGLTGIAEGTSKAQLHRARRLLKEVLEG